MTVVIGRKILHGFQDEFQSERLVPALTSGAVIGVTEVMDCPFVGQPDLFRRACPLSSIRHRDRADHCRDYDDRHRAHQFSAGCNGQRAR